MVFKSAEVMPETARFVVVAAPPASEVKVARPVFEIEKSVVVALAVEEPTANRVVAVSPLLPWMESFAQGVVVPMPRKPALVSRMRSSDELFSIVRKLMEE